MPAYFDIDEAILIEHDFIDDLLYVRDLKQRKIFLNSDITPESCQEVMHHILQFNKEDEGVPVNERVPIKLYITSDGGDMDSGYGIIDCIKYSITPVYTINLAYQFSMAFLIGIAGTKRYTMPHAKFLMHDGSTYVCNSTSKAWETMEYYTKNGKKTKEFVIENSGEKMTEELYDQKYSKEWYMDADEAKEYGFTDYIIGVDCEISEII